MKGLLVNIYQAKNRNHTPANLFGAKDKIIMVADDLKDGIEEPEEGEFYVKVISKKFSFSKEPYYSAIPYRNGKPFKIILHNGPMAGGNFVYTTDSRVRELFPYPIPLHDRYEAQRSV